MPRSAKSRRRSRFRPALALAALIPLFAVPRPARSDRLISRLRPSNPAALSARTSRAYRVGPMVVKRARSQRVARKETTALRIYAQLAARRGVAATVSANRPLRVGRVSVSRYRKGTATTFLYGAGAGIEQAAKLPEAVRRTENGLEWVFRSGAVEPIRDPVERRWAETLLSLAPDADVFRFDQAGEGNGIVDSSGRLWWVDL